MLLFLRNESKKTRTYFVLFPDKLLWLCSSRTEVFRDGNRRGVRFSMPRWDFPIMQQDICWWSDISIYTLCIEKGKGERDREEGEW